MNHNLKHGQVVRIDPDTHDRFADKVEEAVTGRVGGTTGQVSLAVMQLLESGGITVLVNKRDPNRPASPTPQLVRLDVHDAGGKRASVVIDRSQIGIIPGEAPGDIDEA